MRYFPTFFDLKGQPVLLVGGRETALRKLRLLLKADAAVTVVAPSAETEIAALAAEDKIQWITRSFEATDLDGRRLVISATERDAVDQAVSEAAQARSLPVNVVDRPALSSFIMPAVIDRDPLVVAVSSGGTSPVLARRLREKIEALLPANIGRLARFAETFRGAVEANFASGSPRRRFWESFFDGPVAGAVLDGNERSARERMLALVNRGNASSAAGTTGAVAGKVAIVGAGPGDPDLLTVKALRALQDADVVVYDRLVAPEILDYARRDADRIYVGKAKGHHSKSQTEINALLVHHARAGRQVVRLKGGDPFVFGRGGEEQAELRAHGITVEVVPGITAAAGCAAAAGIPLTHRGLAQALTIVTGHAEDGEPDLDWAALAKANQTLAIYMGVSTAGRIAGRLIENGRDRTTPIAIIENGTRADQKIARGHLGEAEALLKTHSITGPALIIVGEVVREADHGALDELQRALAG